MGLCRGIAPANRLGEAPVTLSTVQYLFVPGWAEDLYRYQNCIDRLLAAPAAPAPDDGRGDAYRLAGSACATDP